MGGWGGGGGVALMRPGAHASWLCLLRPLSICGGCLGTWLLSSCLLLTFILPYPTSLWLPQELSGALTQFRKCWGESLAFKAQVYSQAAHLSFHSPVNYAHPSIYISCQLGGFCFV